MGCGCGRKGIEARQRLREQRLAQRLAQQQQAERDSAQKDKTDAAVQPK